MYSQTWDPRLKTQFLQAVVHGVQMLPWVHEEDKVAIFQHCVEKTSTVFCLYHESIDSKTIMIC